MKIKKQLMEYLNKKDIKWDQINFDEEEVFLIATHKGKNTTYGYMPMFQREKTFKVIYKFGTI